MRFSCNRRQPEHITLQKPGKLLSGLRRLPILALALLTAGAAPADPVQVLDRFESAEGWSTVAGRGASAAVAHDRRGSALRIDFDFTQGGGEVIIHKRFPVRLPPNYAIAFSLRGAAPPNGLELRLVDASGQNVWRARTPEFRFPRDSRTLRVKRRRFEFAWGSQPAAHVEELGLFELVITRGQGGKGSLWIDQLRIEPRAPERLDVPAPLATASGALPSRPPESVLQSATSPTAGWHGAQRPASQWLALDFQYSREYGGLIVDWDADDYATAYTVERSDDGRDWRRVYTVARGNGGRDYLPLPESESRHVRLALQRSSRGRGYGIRHIEVAPPEFGASRNRMFEWMARDSERGHYPRYFSGEQTYWTVTGSAGTESSGAEREALLGEDGSIEPDEGGFSIEPFLYLDGKLHGWADGNATQSLEQGYLPIPSVHMERGPLALTVTALAHGQDSLLVRYRLGNRGTQPVTASLFLAMRPFQVNPPWQSLHDGGGTARIHRLRVRDGALWADGETAVLPLTPPAQLGVMGFDEYPLTELPARDAVPKAQAVTDANGLASGLLRYPFTLAPGERREVYLSLPARHGSGNGKPLVRGMEASTFWAQRHAEAVRHWQERVGRVRFRLPPQAEEMRRAVQSNLAYILIHRDGPALRPGSRRYGRTWIRDGAVASAVLLAFGHDAEVREFLRWYAGYQTPDGAVPCCLDPWGPDSMIEHDSAGEFIYTVANYYRHTGDLDLLHALWPRVARAADYLNALRRRRLTPDYAQGEGLRYRGLLPESASHEGYVAHPVHSYWDDFWAIRGLADAALLAAALGDGTKAGRYAESRDALRAAVEQSVALTQRALGLDHVPGAAELGDYDPSSTAIALSVGDAASGALEPSLRRTFGRYSADLQARMAGEPNWQAYAPYEFRNVSALVRLGERDAAFRALRSLFEGRRPAAWNQWPEVVWRDPRAPRFLGDLPHSWIGAEFIQAFLALFVYEEAGRRLVLGAGLPRAWLEAPDGVAIEGLRTPYGILGYRATSPGPGETRFRIEAGLRLPPQGILVDPPLPRPPRQIEVNGVARASTDDRVAVRALPAEIIFRY